MAECLENRRYRESTYSLHSYNAGKFFFLTSKAFLLILVFLGIVENLI